MRVSLLAEAVLEPVILLSQPPKYWDYRGVPPRLAPCMCINKVHGARGPGDGRVVYINQSWVQEFTYDEVAQNHTYTHPHAYTPTHACMHACTHTHTTPQTHTYIFCVCGGGYWVLSPGSFYLPAIPPALFYV